MRVRDSKELSGRGLGKAADSGRVVQEGPGLRAAPHSLPPGPTGRLRDSQAQRLLGTAWDSAMVSVAGWLLEDTERPEPRWQRVWPCRLRTPTGPRVPLPWKRRWRGAVVLGEQRVEEGVHTAVAIGEAGGQVVDNAGGAGASGRPHGTGQAATARGRKQAQKSSTIPRMR